MNSARRTSTHLAVVAALVAVALGLGPGAAAADEGESVTEFASAIDVDARGDLHVTERIEYSFAGTQHHGLERKLRTGGPDADRIYPVSQVSASSPSGAPAQVAVSTGDGLTVVRVGDPSRTVSGQQTYVLRYTVAGAFDRVPTPTPQDPGAPPLPPHDELYWNVTGTDWDVPIGAVSVRVAAPRPAVAARCYFGPQGSTTGCSGTAGVISTFSAPVTGLRAREGLTAVVAYPTGTVTDPGPLRDAGSARPPQAEPSVLGQVYGCVLLVAVIAGFALLVSRLRRSADPGSQVIAAGPRGSVPAAAPVEPTVPDDPIDWEGLPAPPPGLRPGQLGVLRDGRAGAAAVTATLVDLAVRGHLLIGTTPDAADPPRPDEWLLTARPNPVPGQLLPYEQTLLAAVGTRRTGARLRDLHERELIEAQAELVLDATARGWFAGGTPKTEIRGIAGKVLAFVGFAVFVLATSRTAFPLSVVGFALFAIGGVLGAFATGDRSATRTPAGEAVAAQVDRFAEELSTVPVERLRPDDPADAAGRLLPFAIALGLSPRWTGGGDPSDPSPRWFAAAGGVAGLGAAVSAFSLAIENATRPTTTRSSGSSGFSSSSSSSSSSSGFDSSGSSGGGGGGGGGSW